MKFDANGSKAANFVEVIIISKSFSFRDVVLGVKATGVSGSAPQPTERCEDDGPQILAPHHLRLGCTCRVDSNVFWKTQSDTEANTSR